MSKPLTSMDRRARAGWLSPTGPRSSEASVSAPIDMGRIPAQLSALLRDLVARLPVFLGRNLVGIYLYGSLTQSAFNSARSDVDCIVVTEHALSDAQFRRLREWLVLSTKSNTWTARLQMSFLLRDEVLTEHSPSCLYQFGKLKRSRSDANPIIWMNVLKSGVVLNGPRPEAFVPRITPEILFRALVREVGYLREEIIEKRESKWRDVAFYRAYAVLTLCRILYSFKMTTVTSKPRAAKWAINHLPDELSKIVTQALASDAGKLRGSISLRRIARFIDFVDAELHATRS
jgi:predicted nucleotidyltransferase